MGGRNQVTGGQSEEGATWGKVLLGTQAEFRRGWECMNTGSKQEVSRTGEWERWDRRVALGAAWQEWTQGVGKPT